MDIIHKKVPLLIVVIFGAGLVLFGIYFARKVATIAEDIAFMETTLHANSIEAENN